MKSAWQADAGVSGQEWLELAYDALPDKAKDRLKHEKHRFMREVEWQGSAFRPSVKLYFYAEAEVHLRFFGAERQGWHFEPADCCARFKAAVGTPTILDAAALDFFRETHEGIRMHGNRKPAVLVDIRQLGQLPESPSVRVIPSVVRLQALNACSCASREAPNLVCGSSNTRPLASIGKAVVKDRELRSPLVGGRVLAKTGNVQGKGEMVQGAPHVMDALSDPDMPFLRYLANFFDADSNSPLTITIGSSFHKISCGSFPNQLFKHSQMLLRPVELG